MAKPGSRVYTEAEKLAAITFAVLHNTTEAERQLSVPHSTISNWLEAAGGVGAVRRELESKALAALQDARRATAAEWVRRVEDMPDGELAETFRAMLKETLPPLAGASAQASVIMVQLSGDEVLELPHTPQEHAERP